MGRTDYIHSPTYFHYKKHIEKEYLRTGELRARTINNGIVLPIRNCNGIYLGGVISECGDYINESAQLAGTVHRANGKYEYNEESLVYSERKIVYLGTSLQPNQWGHLITDGFARLWRVNETVLKDHYVCFNSNEGKDYKITGNCLKLLRLYGIPAERIVVVSQPTRFSSVIVPEAAFVPGISYHENHNAVFDVIIKNAMSMADGGGGGT